MLISLGGVALAFTILAVVLVLIAAPIVLALFIVGAILRLVFFVLFLPFRLLGALFGLGFGMVGLLLRGLILSGGIVFLLLLGLLPILPFLLIGAGLYLVLRGARRPSTPVGQA